MFVLLELKNLGDPQGLHIEIQSPLLSGNLYKAFLFFFFFFLSFLAGVVSIFQNFIFSKSCSSAYEPVC